MLQQQILARSARAVYFCTLCLETCSALGAESAPAPIDIESMDALVQAARRHEANLRPQYAVPIWRDLMAQCTAAFGADHWRTAYARFGLLSCERVAAISVSDLRTLYAAFTEAEAELEVGNMSHQRLALRAAQQAAALTTELVGEDSFYYTRSLRLLASARQSANDAEGALKAARECIRLYEKHVGIDSEPCAQSWAKYAEYCYYNSMWYECVDALVHALRLYAQGDFAEGEPPFLRVMCGMVLTQLQEYRKARQIFDQYARTIPHGRGAETAVRVALQQLIWSDLRDGRVEDAQRHYDELQLLPAVSYRSDDYRQAIPDLFMGFIAIERGELDSAERHLRAAASFYPSEVDQNFIGYSDVLWGIGKVHRREGRLSSSEYCPRGSKLILSKSQGSSM
jgi:tetratricopeptide (TPR) repeat protein